MHNKCLLVMYLIYVIIDVVQHLPKIELTVGIYWMYTKLWISCRIKVCGSIWISTNYYDMKWVVHQIFYTWHPPTSTVRIRNTFNWNPKSNISCGISHIRVASIINVFVWRGKWVSLYKLHPMSDHAARRPSTRTFPTPWRLCPSSPSVSSRSGDLKTL